MKSYIPFAIAAALLVSSCGKKDDARPAASQPPLPKSEDSKPLVPAPPIPAPIVPKGAEAPTPPAGQAGDTSNPDFKGGGVPEKNK